MMYALTIVPFLLLAPQEDPARVDVLRAIDPALTAVGETAAQDRRIRILDVADLTGADRLDALREAIENDLLDEEVRYAALGRYLDLIETGEMDTRVQGLVEAIETFCVPNTAGLRIGVPSPGVLIVAASESVHTWIDQFLAAMRGFDGQVLIAIEIFKVDAGTAADVWGGRTGVLLDEAHLGDLLVTLEGAAERVNAPAVLTNPAQHASLVVGEQIAYVKDYEFTVLPGRDVEIADPVIDVIQTGTSIDVIAVPVGDGRLAVEIQYAEARAETPFREFTTTLGVGNPVTVQLPELRVAKVNARFELDPGAAIAMSVKDPDDETKDIIVVMKASRIEAQRGTDGGGTDQRR